jgi:single-stranded-DNA-specific exonuclease
MAVRRLWQVAQQDRLQINALADACGVPPLVAHLLLLRGLATAESATRFLQPALSHFTDPFLLTDMATAVKRITLARDRQERVLVFGDYDVDGVTSCALMSNGLRRFGLTSVECGMPLRLSEGYGLSVDRVEDAHARGITLIITVDNGIKAHDAATRARELALDLIITDHHSIDGELPEALAVINPKRETEDYPGYYMSGAGVAFKLCTALNGTMNDLDIAAIGTVADIVPLLGENRLIVCMGLRHIIRHRRKGIAALAQVAGITLDDLRSEHIAFQLGPRLNAAGRLDDALLALDLLLCDEDSRAQSIARQLNEHNQERQGIERMIFQEAAEELDATLTNATRGVVVAREGWHPGVIGIVASRLQSRYSRPAVVIAIDEQGTGKGSARSGPVFDMVAALQACDGLLLKYGGHRAAAGFSIEAGRIPEFTAAFDREARRQLGGGELCCYLPVDGLASFSEIDGVLIKGLNCLEPLGCENPAPVFCSYGVEYVRPSARLLKETHLKLQLRQGGSVFSAIGFGMGERLRPEEIPDRVDIAYTPKLNTYRNETTIQLVLKDLRPAE